MARCDDARPWLRRTLIVAGTAKRVVRLPEIGLLNGATIAPGAWSGVAAVIVFWSTGCGFCEHHNARIEKSHQATRGRRLRVLGATRDGGAERVREHAARHGLQL